MFKKSLLVGILIGFAIILSSCFDDSKIFEEPTEDKAVKTSFVDSSFEYKLNKGTVNLFYFENNSLPYIDVKDYINLLKGVYKSDEFKYKHDYTKSLLTLEFFYHVNETQAVIFKLTFDFENDIITTPDLDFFNVYLEIPDDQVEFEIEITNLIVTKKEEVSFDLGKYGFDMVIKDESFLVPLTIINLLFNQNLYFDLYFNGQELHAIDTINTVSNEKLLKRVQKSRYNKGPSPQSIKLATRSYMAFVLDYFFGLRDYYKANSTYWILGLLKETYLKNSTQAIFETILKLDEPHSSYIAEGFYQKEPLGHEIIFNTFRARMKKYFTAQFEILELAQMYFGSDETLSNVPEFKVYDFNGIAEIYIKEFDLDTPKKIEKIISELPDYISDIIMDVTFNTGGVIGSALETAAIMTNEEMKYHVYNPLDKSNSTFTFKGTKPALSKYNYMVRTSGVTFSAANLFASIAKEAGIPIIGQKSSGGASSISVFVTPEGSILSLSSNTVFSHYVNDVLQPLEKGVDLDLELKNLYHIKEVYQYIQSKNDN